MNLQQIHPKVLVYLLEFSGKAGVMCQTPEMLEDPHFNKAFSLFMGLSEEELDELLQTVVHQSGYITNWHKYLNYNKRAYKREYLGSEEWKRKRNAVMNRAMQPLPPDPENLVIVYERDEYGRVIEAIKVEWKPICEVKMCITRIMIISAKKDWKTFRHFVRNAMPNDHQVDLEGMD